MLLVLPDEQNNKRKMNFVTIGSKDVSVCTEYFHIKPKSLYPHYFDFLAFRYFNNWTVMIVKWLNI